MLSICVQSDKEVPGLLNKIAHFRNLIHWVTYHRVIPLGKAEALSGLFSENSYFVGRGIGDSFKTKTIESFEVYT